MLRNTMHGRRAAVVAAVAALGVAGLAHAQGRQQPSFDDVVKGYEKIQTSTDGPTLFGLWHRKKDDQLLAELPRGWNRQQFFVAVTPAAGVIFSGLQGPATLVEWQRFDDRLALVEPNLAVRSSGGQASRQSVDRIFTDRVLLDVPIVTTGPSGQPVIDLDDMLVRNAGRLAFTQMNARLTKVDKAKAFPENIEIALTGPDPSGSFKTLHFSISRIPGRSDYKPREADDRIGYFLTPYRDLGEYGTETNWKRYINRWDLRKRDPKLKLSPPKEPIVFYVEHTVPVRYRRFVRDGILQWNEAFRQIGIDQAIIVRQQDEVSGAHMEKDAEDVRYNFVRWLNNDIATAIGPSRAHPVTGEILDADIVLTDGWIRAFFSWYEGRPWEVVESLTPEVWTWLEQHPDWDPRLTMVSPEDAQAELAQRRARAAAGDPDPARSTVPPVIAANEHLAEMEKWLGTSCRHCLAAHGMAREMNFAAVHLEMTGMLDADALAAAAENEDVLDGLPESFVGPQLAHLVAHEVGHTLGLRHNFKASSIYSLDEINSEDMKGQVTLGGSVMDYMPTNFNVDEDGVQGDYTMIDIGPYDKWAIEYGYTFGDPKEVAARVGEPHYVYLTDEDTVGPDPLARRYDFSSDPLDYAEAMMTLVTEHREKLLDVYVKDGDSWERARRGYLATLRRQRSMIDMMANWLGGTHVNRVRKGDENTGDPLEPVDPAQQRAALDFVVESAFYDEVYGLTPELLNKMTLEKWNGAGGMRGSSAWPVHREVSATQSLALTLVMNPGTLGGVYDNELRTPADEDAVTLPEVMDVLMDAIYEELDPDGLSKKHSDRAPMISSLRRGLQADMTDRLITFATGNARVSQEIRQVALLNLRRLNGMLEEMVDAADGDDIDTYSLAHVQDMHTRTSRALDSIYVAQ